MSNISVAYRKLHDTSTGADILTPIIPVSIRNDQTSQWFNFDMELDTGATITVLPRSIAQILGLELEKGYATQLAGVGGNAFVAYIHRITIKLNGNELEIYAAFASIEVPALLGRFTVLDQINEIKLENSQGFIEINGIQPKTLPLLSPGQVLSGQPSQFPFLPIIAVGIPTILAIALGLRGGKTSG